MLFRSSVNLRLVKRYETWLFIAYGFFSVMGFMVIWFSLATYARSIGLTANQGSMVTAVMNIGQMFGRPAVGFFSDWTGRMNVTTFASFVSGLLCLLLWVFARTYAALTCFALFAGVLFGTFWTVRQALDPYCDPLEYLANSALDCRSIGCRGGRPR